MMLDNKLTSLAHEMGRLVLVTLALLSVTRAELNLYMNDTETSRILGIEGELNYVRDNIVNEYAFTFNVPIGSSIHTIYFTWANKQPTHQMWYNQSISISNEDALHMPKTSLAKEGEVPSKTSVFWVALACTGRQSAQVDVHIRMHVAIFSDVPPILLHFRRRKTCLRAPPVVDREYMFPHSDQDPDPDYPQSQHDHESEASVTSRLRSARALLLYGVLSVVLLALLVLALVASLCYCRARKRANERLSDTSSAALTQYLRTETPKSSLAGQGGGGGAGSVVAPGSGVHHNKRPPLAPLMQLSPEEVDHAIHEIQIDQSQLALGHVLMEGSFGRVLRGTLLLDASGGVQDASMDVQVKTVTEAASASQVDVFLRESCLLKGQLHANVNPLIATCIQGLGRPPLLVFPYLSEGNLKHFLLRCQGLDRGSAQALSTQQLVYIAIQIVRAVQYLHKQRIVHRDIATRNCLIDSQLVVRLGDNALARDLFPADYHCLGDNENRPVKWLSLEALLHNQYSYSSDVWSFGVTVWEVMTLAQQPYADVDAFEMDAYLREGYRVSQPINCPDELFAVMACCWSLVPEERPRVAQLCTCLQDFYTAICQYI